MKYIWNKTRLLNFIRETLLFSGIDYKWKKVYDLFCWTWSVSSFFLENDCEVYSCDNMNYSIAEQYRKLYFKSSPDFSELKQKYWLQTLKNVLDYLNNLEGVKWYFYDNFCENWKYWRRFFKDSNAEKIDAIRWKIEERKYLLPFEKYMFLVWILMNAADFVSNTAWTYWAYLKIRRSMALKDLILEEPEYIGQWKMNIFLDDVVDFVETKPEVDIAYMDPPYNTRQYPAYFSALESIVVNDFQELKWKSWLRDYENQRSKFSIKKDVLNEFEKLVSKIRWKYIVMSYSTEGIMKVEDIIKILEKYWKVEVYWRDYRRFKTNARTDTNTNLKELILICKK